MINYCERDVRYFCAVLSTTAFKDCKGFAPPHKALAKNYCRYRVRYEDWNECRNPELICEACEREEGQ